MMVPPRHATNCRVNSWFLPCYRKINCLLIARKPARHARLGELGRFKIMAIAGPPFITNVGAKRVKR